MFRNRLLEILELIVKGNSDNSQATITVFSFERFESR
jgi:hypothetical protein